MSEKIESLIVVLGDQLDTGSPLVRASEEESSMLWMAEVTGEAEYCRSTKMRTTQFLAAMRDFRHTMRSRGKNIRYHELGAAPAQSLPEALAHDLRELEPARVVVMEPGEFRLEQALGDVVNKSGAELVRMDDPHFLCSRNEFAEWREGQGSLLMERFYRQMRQRYEVLLDADGGPEGGAWNYDSENRASFDKEGPPEIPERRGWTPNQRTRAVMQAVQDHFPEYPGSLEAFDWPINRRHAREVLDTFIDERLPDFGTYQDAMWTEQPWLFHAHISSSLNLKFLDPREVIEAAVDAYRDGHAPLNAVEGFVRQILGWREYVRGIYWTEMPGYLEQNQLDQQQDLPSFYWSGETDMRCLAETLRQTLELGYAHHIQRLMVTGVFALLYGVEPRQIHKWYLAVYVDAVEWVESPNVIGMSQYADGGLLASKPYAAGGNYINKMSNYCRNCRYNYRDSVGEDACPFTTMYWDFVMRFEDRFSKHPRTARQWSNLRHLDADKRKKVKRRAQYLRRKISDGGAV